MNALRGRHILSIRNTLFLVVGLITVILLSPAGRMLAEDAAIDVGTRRQLFVDGYLIEKMTGARHVLHRPVRRDVAIAPEHPWEQHGVSYMVTFKDGGRFRAWYRVDAAGWDGPPRNSMTAYAESDDGIHWRKPSLGIIEFQGSKENNLVWAGDAANLAPFRDE